MSLILDAGAFIAVERADRDTVALIKQELIAGSIPITHGGIVGQVWRGGAGGQSSVAGCFLLWKSPVWVWTWTVRESANTDANSPEG